jgi:hypothetical protein
VNKPERVPTISVKNGMSDRRRKSAPHPPTRWINYDTAMARAFLNALIAWAARHVSDSSARILLPTGHVGVGELMRVLAALDQARERAS